MAGGGSIILRDIPPYVICNGNPCSRTESTPRA